MPGGWVAYAKCKGMETEWFFPTYGGPHATDKQKEFCRSCPVRVECLDYAIEHRIEHGVWGGKDTEERQAIRRQCREEVA